MFISTYLLQTHYLEASKTGEISQPCSEEGQASAGLRLQVWSQSPCSIFRNMELLFLLVQKREAEGLPNVQGWVLG